MHLQDINKLLNLQDINIVNISEIIDSTVFITLEPTEYIQACPYCSCDDVIRRGKSGYRHVRHLPIFEDKTILRLPKIRMCCKNCNASFTWQYSFVTGKSRYSSAFKAKVSQAVTGSTVTHACKIMDAAYSTIERIFKNYLKVYCWKEDLIEWYDCCINISQAKKVFDRWINYGESLDIPEVNSALNTFKNWTQEIINYYACRFTNAAVEGRNNKIRALQRRHYFARNRKYYNSRILLECNTSFLTA